MQRYYNSIGRLSKTFVKPKPCPIRYFTTDKTQDEKEVFKNAEQVVEKNEEPVVEKNAEQVVEKNAEQVVAEKIELSGFAKAFEKFSAPEPIEPERVESFAHLVRHSKFIDLGDPEGKMVSGKIFHVVGDDLYIDFGWKFHCVCTRPVKNGGDYVRGANVRLRIKQLELSTRFLGASKDLTILEADCTLMGLINSPMRNVKNVL